MTFRTVVPAAAEGFHVELACLRVFAFLGEGDHAVGNLGNGLLEGVWFGEGEKRV